MYSSHQILQTIQEKSSLALTFAVGSLYTVYYLCIVVKKPRIMCQDKRLLKLLEHHCPISKNYYWPSWWCFQSHSQTLLRAFLQSFPQVTYRSEFLQMPDGGRVKLDWADGDNSYPAITKPTVLLLPGLTGSSGENYVLHMVREILKLGCRSLHTWCVVFNNRGVGGVQLLTSRTYCAANTEDLEFVVNHIRTHVPEAPVLGVGVSLGSVILLNYLAAKGAESGLSAGMCISVIWNLLESATSLEKPINLLLYNRYLARSLVKNVESNSDIFKSSMDMDHILKSSTIREFDDRFTAKQFGFESCEHYYKAASPDAKISAIQVPVLTLNAADDPFCPLHAIPEEKALQNDHIAMVITSFGGHIGFLEGTWPRGRNYMHRWLSQFVDAIFQHGLKKD